MTCKCCGSQGSCNCTGNCKDCKKCNVHCACKSCSCCGSQDACDCSGGARCTNCESCSKCCTCKAKVRFSHKYCNNSFLTLIWKSLFFLVIEICMGDNYIS